MLCLFGADVWGWSIYIVTVRTVFPFCTFKKYCRLIILLFVGTRPWCIMIVSITSHATRSSIGRFVMFVRTMYVLLPFYFKFPVSPGKNHLSPYSGWFLTSIKCMVPRKNYKLFIHRHLYYCYFQAWQWLVII